MYCQLCKADALKILTHPEIYPLISDDNSLEPTDFTTPEGMTCLVCYDPEPIACAILYPVNGIAYQTHVQVLPEARSQSYQAGHAMVDWVWKNMDAEKLLGATPENNRIALLYTLKLGFKIEGFSPKSFLKDGQLIGQTLTGLERSK